LRRATSISDAELVSEETDTQRLGTGRDMAHDSLKVPQNRDFQL